MFTRLSRPGLPLALLALIAQLALGAFVPSSVDLFAAQPLPICRGAPDSGAPPTAPTRHFPHLAPCPLCTGLFATALTLPAAPDLPTPTAFALPRPELPPPATAPPATARLAAQPRGPPACLT